MKTLNHTSRHGQVSPSPVASDVSGAKLTTARTVPPDKNFCPLLFRFKDGMFTAPSGGIYQFYTNLRARKWGNPTFGIMANDQGICTAQGEHDVTGEDAFGQITCSGLAQLEEGE